MEEHQLEVDELLSETLTPEELSTLLERLGEAQFGGSDHPTVGAVVEATGASPLVVGRILADIRKDAFESRFEQTFGDHDERITKLERTPEAASSSSQYAEEQREAIERVAERELRNKEMQPYFTAIMIVLAILVFLVIAKKLSGP